MQRQEADRARKAADRAAEEREDRATRQHYAELQQKEAARQQQQREAERLPGPLGGRSIRLGPAQPANTAQNVGAAATRSSNLARSPGRAKSGSGASVGSLCSACH